ncbi:MAG: hypothetical protein JW856_05210 [Dehalococcoidales bacterium]|nr:hypothetical protein [Dehalococcoidales bacterium]
MEVNWYFFLFGCIGSAANEIYRLWKIRTDPNLKFPVHYYVISIFFFLLGGVVAIPLAKDLWSAFATGIALPAILSKAIGEVSPQAATPTATTATPATPTVTPATTARTTRQEEEASVGMKASVKASKTTTEALQTKPSVKDYFQQL